AAVQLPARAPVTSPTEPPTTTNLLLLPAPLSPEVLNGRQSSPPKATASPPAMTRNRHAPDAVFEAWDDADMTDQREIGTWFAPGRVGKSAISGYRALAVDN